MTKSFTDRSKMVYEVETYGLAHNFEFY